MFLYNKFMLLPINGHNMKKKTAEKSYHVTRACTVICILCNTLITCSTKLVNFVHFPSKLQ